MCTSTSLFPPLPFFVRLYLQFAEFMHAHNLGVKAKMPLKMANPILDAPSRNEQDIRRTYHFLARNCRKKFEPLGFSNYMVVYGINFEK